MPEYPNPKLRETPPPNVKRAGPSALGYAELDVKSNFSFLRGASHADELVYRAAGLGHRAIAVTDFNSLAGAVRMHEAAKAVGVKLIVGARLAFVDAPDLLVWAPDRAAYAGLCRLLTLGKRRAQKGECELRLADFLEANAGLLAAVVLGSERGQRDRGTKGQSEKPRPCDSHFVPLSLRPFVPPYIASLRDALGNRLSLSVSCGYGADDIASLRDAFDLSRAFDIPLLATNDVYYHEPSRRRLQDVLTCVRHGCTIQQAGFKLFPNAERYLKSPQQMHRLFADCPQAIRRGLEIAERCSFSLGSLKYEYPDELVPPGKTSLEFLSDLTWDGAKNRYPAGVPEKVRRQIEHELRLIAQLKFEPYFLTVHDLVRFARSRGILCQGRGSAANSAVCYCIGVTSVDPARIDLLFERFISAARDEPPDIDVDFEHERREEVIQYVYQKYGRDRAGMTATVITYRGRSAIRDVGKAMGLSLDMVDSMASKLDWWDRGVLDDDRIRQCGLDPADRALRRVLAVASELLGFPRHLSQHVGGLVMARGLLSEMVPIENASMEDRTVIEWDKDDIDALGLLKVDVLALGMLTCISKAFRLIEGTKGQRDKGTKGEEREARDREEQRGEDVSRPHCVATWDGFGQGHIPDHKTDAAVRTIRIGQPDVEGSVLHSVEHCGGLCEADEARLLEVSPHLPGLAGRTVDPVRTGNQPPNHPAQSTAAQIARRRRSNSPSAHHELGEKDSRGTRGEAKSEDGKELNSNPLSLCPFVPLSLRPSVPPSLRPSVPPSLSGPAPLELHTVPPEDPAVYDMVGDADTVGVFQIESRAQMSMLPRLRPRCFYDLVIEVAIVRPGPIQGNMVHPYLRRRCGEEPVVFPSKDLERVLSKTLGVPLFQEQAMKIAMVAAGFSAEEADRLRRAMAAWRRSGALETFHRKIVDGMTGNGYTPEFAEQCYKQIKGFGEYGFPESHAASFALLVYVSAWLKRHHPAAFAAALINSQPMGFYQPAQIVRDARDHGVDVRAADVNESEWDCTLEERHGGEGQRDGGIKGQSGKWGIDGPALRLGLRQIRGLRQADAAQVVATRRQSGRFTSVPEFHRLMGLSVAALRILAEADAFASLGLSRRKALWEVLRLKDEENPLFEEGTKGRRDEGTKGADAFPLCPSFPLSLCPSLSSNEPQVHLPTMPLGQEVMIDYSTTGLSLKKHPVALVRTELAKRRVITAERLNREDLSPHGRWVKVAGLVLIRQRPGTASGIVFETLEDETGVVNLIIKPEIYDRYRPAARHAGLVQADGYVQRSGQVVHVMAKRLFDLGELLQGYDLRSRDFH